MIHSAQWAVMVERQERAMCSETPERNVERGLSQTRNQKFRPRTKSSCPWQNNFSCPSSSPSPFIDKFRLKTKRAVRFAWGQQYLGSSMLQWHSCDKSHTLIQALAQSLIEGLFLIVRKPDGIRYIFLLNYLKNLKTKMITARRSISENVFPLTKIQSKCVLRYCTCHLPQGPPKYVAVGDVWSYHKMTSRGAGCVTDCHFARPTLSL